MKRSTKVISIVVIFFLIITAVIVGRTLIGNHFKKKFGKRPPPGIVVTEVVQKEFSETIESYGTAVSRKTETFRIQKSNLISDLELKEYVKKGGTVFINTHLLENAERLCDRAAIIHQGQIQSLINLGDLRKQNLTLEELFHEIVK